MISIRTYAKTRGLSEPGARKRAFETDTPIVGGKVDGEELDRRFAERQSKREGSGSKLTEARAMREKIKAAREKTLFDRERGELISLEDLIPTLQEFAAQSRNALVPLPLEVAEQWVRMPPQDLQRAFKDHVLVALNTMDADAILDRVTRQREAAQG